MRRLLPEPATEITIAEQLAELRPWEDPPAERPRAMSNFALTLDGQATIGGRSGPIGSDTDTAMLVGLRTRVDAVMIGAGTMRAERYGPAVGDPAKRELRAELGLEPAPLMVIVGSLDLPWDAELFSTPGEVVLITSDEGEPPAVEPKLTILRHRGEVDLSAALAHLRSERGVRALLCEGGPALHAQLIEAGLLDELFITWAPKLAGGDGPGLVSGLSTRTVETELVWLLADTATGELFGRYRLES